MIHRIIQIFSKSKTYISWSATIKFFLTGKITNNIVNTKHCISDYELCIKCVIALLLTSLVI